MKKLVTISMLSISTLIVACSSKEQAKSIDYYLDNIVEAKQVIQDCRSRVKTASDYQKIMGEENCANAELAQQQWNIKQNSSTGKTATKTAPIRFNQ